MRKAFYIMGELTDSDLDWLAENGQRRSIARNVPLIRQGEHAPFVYIVLRGLFAVRDEKLGGRELARLASGEIVGEMSFIQTQPPTATVTALEDGLVLTLPRALLEQKLNADCGFAARFYRALAVFLSDRMRATVRTLGYGATAAAEIEDAARDDAQEPEMLARAHQASQRFERMLKRLGA